MLRLRSPPISRSSSHSQVSIREAICTWLCSEPEPPRIKLVNSEVHLLTFIRSNNRIAIILTSFSLLPVMKLVNGSKITTCGLKALTALLTVSTCISRPAKVGRLAWNCSRPFCTHGSRSIPIERILRMIWLGDSSKEKYRARSPRRQAASAKSAATLLLPVPAVPETSTALPR